MVLRLYETDTVTGKSTGKKANYASEELFKKYGRPTYHRYNRKSSSYRPNGTTSKLCFLNSQNKWEKCSEEQLDILLNH